MSHPDSCYDPDNSYEDDHMGYIGEEDMNYDDYEDFYSENEDAYDDSMDGDHDSAMESAGWGTDEDYGHYGDDIDSFHDYYGEDY